MINWHGDKETVILPFAVGDRIKLIKMGADPVTGTVDPCPIEPGSTGIVRSINWSPAGDWQVGVAWDNGRTLSMIIPPDRAVKENA